MRGTRVTCLEQLSFAAKYRIAVTGNSGMFRPGRGKKRGGPSLPAAFVINMSGGQILELIRRGLWFYVPDAWGARAGEKEREGEKS